MRRRRGTLDGDLLPEKRERVIAAALEEFAERGYLSASTNAIAEKAGVAKGLIFHYFGSKKKLYLHLVDHAFAESVAWFDRAESAEKPSSDFVERIVEGSLRMLGFLREHPVLSRLIEGAWTTAPEELQPEVLALAQKYQSTAMGGLLEGIDRNRLREGVEPGKAAALLSVFVEGFKDAWAKQAGRGFQDADMMLAQLRDYCEMLKYGIYRPGE